MTLDSNSAASVAHSRENHCPNALSFLIHEQGYSPAYLDVLGPFWKVLFVLIFSFQ